MNRRPVIGVMGGGSVTPAVLDEAEAFGGLVAERGWVLLTGGRDAGVMAAASRGARSAGGLVVGILPFRGPGEGDVSSDVDVAVFTGMGDARNVVNVLTSDVVVAFPGGPGTTSEVALALKSGKPVILLGYEDRGLFREGADGDRVRVAATPEEGVRIIERLLS